MQISFTPTSMVNYWVPITLLTREKTMSMMFLIIISNFLCTVINSYTLSNCTAIEEGMRCERYCESIWFRFLSLNGSHSGFVPKCDPIFQKKYANIMYLAWILSEVLGNIIALVLPTFLVTWKHLLEKRSHL